MNRHTFIRVLMEQAGTPTDAGSAGTPNADPKPAPSQDPKPADNPTGTPAQGPNPNPAPNADPKPAANNGAPADGKKKTLLGGAQADTTPDNGSAEPKPNGGNQPGDGKQTTPQDPYAELKFPDGAAVDEKQMAEYKNLAKDLNLPSESAQRILDFEAKRLAAGAAQASQEWQEQVKQEYGDKLPTVMATCARAIGKFGGDELRDLLDQTGLGNHPLMVKVFYNAGALLKEDKSIPASGTQKGNITFTEALYGTHSK